MIIKKAAKNPQGRFSGSEDFYVSSGSAQAQALRIFWWLTKAGILCNNP